MKFSQLSRVFLYNKRTVLALVVASAFSILTVYATPPTSPYSIGETLDPLCAPGDANCTVTIFPDQTGNGGKFLRTNGTTTSWITIDTNVLTGSTSTFGSETWLGVAAGNGSGNSLYSVMIGYFTGLGTTNATRATFLGSAAGSNAVNASSSVFAGFNAGYSATNAAHSIFIGAYAGYNDTVNNSFSGTSILIGEYASTSGYSNSIAIGHGVANSAASQLNIGNVIYASNIYGSDTPSGSATATGMVGIGNAAPSELLTLGTPTSRLGVVSLAGSTSGKVIIQPAVAAGVWTWTLPTSDGTTGDVLSTDGNGVTSWVSAGGGGATLTGSTSTIATEAWFGGGSNGSGASSVNTVFIGESTGFSATLADNSVFIGASAGFSSTNASNSVFIGTNAGQSITSDGNNNTFIGDNAGNTADQSAFSTFVGSSSGSGTTKAGHAIFIGANAGVNDILDTSGGGTSILIGENTLTNGNIDSIALGEGAVNTTSNQFMIGSTSTPINEVNIIGSSAQTCTIRPDTAGISCTSDERLKANIEDLTDTLDTLSHVRTISYNWNNTPDSNPQIGFLAQDLQQYFPTLVTTASNGFYQVNYAGMTPILTKAIQELDIKIESLEALSGNTISFQDQLVAWLSNASNRITRIFTGEVCLTDTDGTSECLNKSQLTQLKTLLNTPINNTPNTVVVPEPEIPTEEVVVPDVETPVNDLEVPTVPDIAPVQEIVIPEVPIQEEGSTETPTETQ